ncbi:MAG: Lrp/AsnC family transcriptional regulator [Candidatus Bathyarchaeia archaeon]
MLLKIDELDQKILKILEEDGRISYRQLGKKLGIEESTARKRVLRLREKGVIERFTIEINEATLGRTITAFITVYPSLKHADRVIKEVVNFDEVLESYNLSGRCGIFLKAMFGDMKALNKFLTKIRNIGGITGMHTCISLETLKKPRITHKLK